MCKYKASYFRATIKTQCGERHSWLVELRWAEVQPEEQLHRWTSSMWLGNKYPLTQLSNCIWSCGTWRRLPSLTFCVLESGHTFTGLNCHSPRRTHTHTQTTWVMCLWNSTKTTQKKIELPVNPETLQQPHWFTPKLSFYCKKKTKMMHHAETDEILLV